jgi:chromosomal replication initiation ATPase DnaA
MEIQETTTLDISTITQLDCVDLDRMEPKKERSEIIKDAVLSHLGLNWFDIDVKSREERRVNARRIYIYFLHMENMTLKQIGRKFSYGGKEDGRIDHTTVMNQLKKHDDYYSTDKFYRETINALSIKINYQISERNG